ncbi:polysaccharide pyruvyl transferase family protein [Facklamia sp. P13055]|uniref:polysaccharide pyruvyl transferase family protein n=1 Tax=Facklamia sp. P13055 TaxID=3421952 RepID=UPI003D16A85C
MKVGIVTLHGYFNYGNRLQNYALLKQLEKLNIQVDTTVVKNRSLERSYTRNLYECLKRHMPSKRSELKRYKIFKEFSENYLNEKFYNISKKSDLKYLDTYDYFITGSDQVWNPRYHNMLDVYFLTFANESKRIAYAPSISRDSLSKEEQDLYSQYLNGMSKISIREESGSKLIRDLIQEEVPVLIDPTLMLDKNEWLKVSKPAPNNKNTVYILTYFLGGPTKEAKDLIAKLCKSSNYKVINLGVPEEKTTYETGPSEFLDYVKKASLFLTDSFHGVAFSIIFETPFVVYERISNEPSMYSRIDTILSMFNLQDRTNKRVDLEKIFDIDFSKVHKRIQIEKEKSDDFLKKALNYYK